MVIEVVECFHSTCCVENYSLTSIYWLNILCEIYILTCYFLYNTDGFTILFISCQCLIKYVLWKPIFWKELTTPTAQS